MVQGIHFLLNSSIFMLHSYSHVPVFGCMAAPPTQPLFCQHRPHHTHTHTHTHTHPSLQTAPGAVAADIVEVLSWVITFLTIVSLHSKPTLQPKKSEIAQSCPTLWDPMDCSLPGSSVHGIFQARVLEWVAIAFSTPG